MSRACVPFKENTFFSFLINDQPYCRRGIMVQIMVAVGDLGLSGGSPSLGLTYLVLDSSFGHEIVMQPCHRRPLENGVKRPLCFRGRDEHERSLHGGVPIGAIHQKVLIC